MTTIDQLIINRGENFSSNLFIFTCILSAVLVLSIFFILFRMGDDERSDHLAYQTAAIVLLVNCALNNFLLFGSIQNWKLFICTNFVLASIIGLLFLSKKYYQFLR